MFCHQPSKGRRVWWGQRCSVSIRQSPQSRAEHSTWDTVSRQIFDGLALLRGTEQVRPNCNYIRTLILNHGRTSESSFIKGLYLIFLKASGKAGPFPPIKNHSSFESVYILFIVRAKLNASSVSINNI